MLLRTSIVLVLLLTVACQQPAPSPLTFPSHVDEWKLVSSRVVQQAPLPLQASRVQQASYERSGAISVHAYELASETVAFEAMQKFRQGEKLAFHKGSRFFTIESPDVDRETLATFASNLQQAIP